mmetsp:Transcript_7460/g.15403  ORF Transcript_7460/g.15403 Transcript_7460/m.15403 type:complete len:249 (+) Transcript_7460:568-1314(+)
MLMIGIGRGFEGRWCGVLGCEIGGESDFASGDVLIAGDLVGDEFVACVGDVYHFEAVGTVFANPKSLQIELRQKPPRPRTLLPKPSRLLLPPQPLRRPRRPARNPVHVLRILGLLPPQQRLDGLFGLGGNAGLAARGEIGFQSRDLVEEVPVGVGAGGDVDGGGAGFGFEAGEAGGCGGEGGEGGEFGGAGVVLGEVGVEIVAVLVGFEVVGCLGAGLRAAGAEAAIVAGGCRVEIGGVEGTSRIAMI